MGHCGDARVCEGLSGTESPCCRSDIREAAHSGDSSFDGGWQRSVTWFAHSREQAYLRSHWRLKASSHPNALQTKPRGRGACRLCGRFLGFGRCDDERSPGVYVSPMCASTVFGCTVVSLASMYCMYSSFKSGRWSPVT